MKRRAIHVTMALFFAIGFADAMADRPVIYRDVHRQRRDPDDSYSKLRRQELSLQRQLLNQQKQQQEKDEKERKIRETHQEMDRIQNARAELKTRFDAIDIKLALDRARIDIETCTNVFDGGWTQEAINHTNLVFRLVKLYRAAYKEAAGYGGNSVVSLYEAAVSKLEKCDVSLRDEIDRFSIVLQQAHSEKRDAERLAQEQKEREEAIAKEREREELREQKRKEEEKRFQEEERKRRLEEEERFRKAQEERRKQEEEEAERARQHELEMHKKNAELASKSFMRAVLLICGMIIAVVAIKLIVDRI